MLERINYKGLIIRGPMGIGKSTTTKKLFNQMHNLDIDCAVIDFDVVRKFGNRRKPTYDNRLLGVKNMISLYKNYLESNYFVILEGVLAEQHMLEMMKNVQPNYKLIRLTSDYNINLNRNNNPDRKWHSEPKMIIKARNMFEKNKKSNPEETIINTTHFSINEVVNKIINYVR